MTTSIILLEALTGLESTINNNTDIIGYIHLSITQAIIANIAFVNCSAVFRVYGRISKIVDK